MRSSHKWEVETSITLSTLNVRNDFKGTLTSAAALRITWLVNSQNRAGLGDVQGRQSLDCDPSFRGIGSFCFSHFWIIVWRAKGEWIVQLPCMLDIFICHSHTRVSPPTYQLYLDLWAMCYSHYYRCYCYTKTTVTMKIKHSPPTFPDVDDRVRTSQEVGWCGGWEVVHKNILLGWGMFTYPSTCERCGFEGETTGAWWWALRHSRQTCANGLSPLSLPPTTPLRQTYGSLCLYTSGYVQGFTAAARRWR